MSTPKFGHRTTESGDLASLAVKLITLSLLEPVFGRYERSAEELRAELAIAEITPDLIMHVCLAAPAVDDLILGFIRDDLQVVSRSDQTRNIFERDIALAQSDAGKSSKEGIRNRPLGEIISAAQREIRAKAGTGTRSELDRFIKENPKVHQEVAALSLEDLARWVMLGLMREMENRRRGSLALATWRQTLAPESKEKIDALHPNSKLKPNRPKQSPGIGL